MTNLIPNSWELPSHLAGDLIDMNRFRDRGVRETVPTGEAEGDAQIIVHPKWKIKRGPVAPAVTMPRPVDDTWAEAGRGLSEVEPYDPEKHGTYEPAELYSLDALDRLRSSGFEHDEGVWNRPVTTDEGEHFGANHTLIYNPGHRRPSDNTRAPWILTTDPESVGEAHSTLTSAISAADREREQMLTSMPKRAGLYLLPPLTSASQSPGRANADDWLERNTPESFEHDPREEARRWMDEHADEYDEWHPRPSDYTYGDFGDTAGQTFHDNGGSESHVLPGSAYQFGDTTPRRSDREEWENSPDHPPADDEDLYDDEEESQDNQTLADHGFNWEPVDSTAGSAENPLSPDTPGKYVKHQIDLEGKHVATHTLDSNRPGFWKLHTQTTEHGLPVTSPSSDHSDLFFALDKYKQNSAETMLPRYGYEPSRGRSGRVISWSKETPHPSGQGEGYIHKISFPEHGFLGETKNVSNGALYAPNGNQAHNSDDLTDVVREQHRLGQGMHPGGWRDYRMTHDELKNHPAVALLGRPEMTMAPWGDHKVNRMTWALPSQQRDEPHTNAEANYNWDTGNYDFKYTRNGDRLIPTHNLFPEGAPVTVPGRQPSLTFGG